ncbi:hypothetical protein [Pseudoalteromonas denitrificans]|uniref:Uncharacterized protein n=1 Tax=Pseudoalteromonas denitrificans DSM 6059 TaxID=1123010 RepID=A0A1I1V8K2_9GAMM|nr:hypothetical protein [Pseudoalteromonas denitrificans]SFD77433.1 hypothetical protein SAMN02745724_05413 [Pseudoalteromonas denitrificans DSM 6059]
MTKNYLTSLIEITDPDNPPQSIRLLARTNDKLNYDDEFLSFYQQGNFLSIVDHGIVTPKYKPAYLSTRQFDAPLAVLPWLVNKLDFFIKPSSQGGLPPNKIATDKEQVSGEYLILTRAMDAGNARREGGYSIYNLVRQNYSNSNHQGVTFSDSYLFQGGLLDLWKDLATKYQNGTL